MWTSVWAIRSEILIVSVHLYIVATDANPFNGGKSKRCSKAQVLVSR